MSRSSLGISVVLVCVLAGVSCSVLRAAEPPRTAPPFEQFAVTSESAGTWSYPETAEELPKGPYFARSGFAAVNRISLDGASLFVAAHTNIHLDREAKKIRLLQGRLAFTVQGASGWRVELKGNAIVPDVKSTLDVSADSYGGQTVNVVQGNAEFLFGKKTIHLAGPMTIQTQPGKEPSSRQQAKPDWGKSLLALKQANRKRIIFSCA